MKLPMRQVALAAALAMTAQPGLAAAGNTGPSLAIAPAATSIAFDLQRRAPTAAVAGAASNVATASMTLSASQQTAGDAQDPPRKRGIGTTTIVVVGGLLLVVLVLAAVAGAMPTAGPHEGAFD